MSNKGNKDDPHFNASGYLDLTSYNAVKRVIKREADERQKYYDDKARVGELIDKIHDLTHKAGYEVEGRIALKDKTTGKVWR